MKFSAITPSQNQIDIARKAIDWYYNSPEQIFQITGGPGTGKSFLLHYIVDSLNLDPWEIAPMAFTGAAAIVMRKKGFYNSRTIHSWLLQPIEKKKKNNKGQDVINSYFNIPEIEVSFVPKPLSPEIKLVVIDEAKMCPLYLRKLLENYPVKVLVAGDINQLDPVASEPGYFIDGEVNYLTEVFRQKADSGIVWIAERIRQHLPIHCGEYTDCLVIFDDEITNEMILGSDVLICGRNDTRDILTHRVREDILHIESSLPSHWERLVCRNNNWQLELEGINLANGLMGCVSNFPDPSGLYKEGQLCIDFKPLMLESSFKNIQVDLEYFRAPFKDKNKFRFLGGRYRGEKFEFGYAITTHIAQGSEFSKGMYFEEFLNKQINTQLHYTGITRFADYCIYVKKKRRYY